MLEEIHLAGSVGGGMGIARGFELISSLGRWASQIAPSDAPRTKTSNF
jgi:hypothetical protein